MGAQGLWAAASFVEALLYFAWPAAGGMLGFVVLLSLLSAVTLAGSTGKNVYRIAVFPREVRVRALAHLRAARNVGFSLGALAGGIALAIGTRAAITSVPLATGAVLILNAVMVAPTAIGGSGHTLPAPPPGQILLTVAPPAWRNRGFVGALDHQRRPHLEPGPAQRRGAAVAGRAD